MKKGKIVIQRRRDFFYLIIGQGGERDWKLIYSSVSKAIHQIYRYLSHYFYSLCLQKRGTRKKVAG